MRFDDSCFTVGTTLAILSIARVGISIGVVRSRRNFGDYGNFGACFVAPIVIVIRFIETSSLPMYLKYL